MILTAAAKRSKYKIKKYSSKKNHFVLLIGLFIKQNFLWDKLKLQYMYGNRNAEMLR